MFWCFARQYHLAVIFTIHFTIFTMKSAWNGGTHGQTVLLHFQQSSND